eukprot:TRINITY_DN4981_c0_g1_i2.p2 TRINITY_DN4981_c0_g1~~TRINITY_DN4981_c0_g1_i2.p2  ORF type:complete len:631 (-),score=126.39 TRINITY_DN4981_c0_g1_i2:77-1969(-)
MSFQNKSAARTKRMQSLLETHCKNVAKNIKKVMDAAEDLKLMEEAEEIEWIKQESEEMKQQIGNRNIFLAKQCSTTVKDLLETVQAKDPEKFVLAAKEAGNTLTALINFASALGIKVDTLREATYKFILTARETFQGKRGSLELLEKQKNDVAGAIRSVVIGASALDTEPIVRARLLQEEKELRENGENTPDTAQPTKTVPGTNPSAEKKNESPGTGKKKLRLTKEQLEILRHHLQEKKGNNSKTQKTPRHRPKPKVPPKPKPAPKRDLADFSKHIGKIVGLQHRMRAWHRVRQVREISLEYLTHDGSERMRKRNMAMWEILSTERTYVNQLEELDRTIIQPLKSEQFSFITEAQIDMLFSNIESILCLNIQLLEAMELRMDAWPGEQHFADILIEKAPVLRLYGEYINSYDRQLEVWSKLEVKKPQFKEWAKSQSIAILNYLILPVQRIPRYEILLRSLKKFTPKEHVDYGNILKALAKVQELNEQTDKNKRKKDNLKNLTEISRCVSGFSSLLVAHRQFLREGAVDVIFPGKKREEKLYAYLFSDIFLLTKPKKGTTVDNRQKCKYRHCLYFKAGCTIDGNTSGNSFKLDDKSASSRIYTVTPADGLQGWLKDFQQALDERGWRKILY